MDLLLARKRERELSVQIRMIALEQDALLLTDIAKDIAGVLEYCDDCEDRAHMKIRYRAVEKRGDDYEQAQQALTNDLNAFIVECDQCTKRANQLVKKVKVFESHHTREYRYCPDDVKAPVDLPFQAILSASAILDVEEEPTAKRAKPTEERVIV